MTAPDEQAAPAGVPAGPQPWNGNDPPPAQSEETTTGAAGPDSDELPQEARAAQRELLAHTPDFILGAGTFGGSLVGGDQHGVSGGNVTGNVYLGGHTEVHNGAVATAEAASGQIPPSDLTKLDAVFVTTPAFDTAQRRLREQRVLVLSGGHSTGRKAAAQIMLHRLGVPSVRALVTGLAPSVLSTHLTRPGGYVLTDPPLSRNRPLREQHLYAMREELEKSDGYLVITVESPVYLVGVTPSPWTPPAVEKVLHAHLTVLGHGPDDLSRQLAPDAVQDFLSRGQRPPAEVAAFARQLAVYDGSETARAALSGFDRAAVVGQCRDWLSDHDIELRDKAFLISLAVFDDASYAAAAESADALQVRFQKHQHPEKAPEIPVFEPALDRRLTLARAEGEQRTERTPWGLVPQYVTRFKERRTARALLSEAWTAHPSARTPLVQWLRDLARDRRPLVRTRAAAAAAVLAAADLPSAVTLLIDGWAVSRTPQPRVTAANALTLAQLLDAPAALDLLVQWCDNAHWARRWTAIRAFALLAPQRPDLAPTALRALADRARKAASSAAEKRNLIESTALLLSGDGRPEMLAELVRLWQQDTAEVSALALAAFLRACENAEEGALVEWYAEGGRHNDDATRDLAMLWRAALNGAAPIRQDALGALRLWVYQAGRRADVLSALERLLPALNTTAADHKRLTHLLTHLPAGDDGTPPSVVRRLLAVLRAAPAVPGTVHDLARS